MNLYIPFLKMNHLQTTICPNCKGWGFITKHQKQDCPNCQGKGVYFLDNNKKIALPFPDFVDYGTRKKIKLIKTVSISISAILGFLFTIFILVLIYNLF